MNSYRSHNSLLGSLLLLLAVLAPSGMIGGLAAAEDGASPLPIVADDTAAESPADVPSAEPLGAPTDAASIDRELEALTKAVEAAGKTPAGDAKPTTSKLRFNFRYAPWKDVVDWFAQQADLSLVTDSYPSGTFNYSDNRERTPQQALDVLNSVLLTKGYTLVQRQKALMLVNLEDGIPANLIESIKPEDLDDKGEYELVSVLFQLDKMTPEEAETEIKRLLGPQGQIVGLAKSRQIQVTETAGRLRSIRKVIQRVEDGNAQLSSQLRTFELKHALPADTLVVLRQLLDIPEDRNVAPDGSIRLAVDPSGKRLLVSGKPEKLARVSQVLEFLDVPKAGQADGPPIDDSPQLEIYSVTTADSQTVLAVMQTLLAGQADVRLAIDAKTGNLIALARPIQHATIRATLEQMQRDSRMVEVIRLHSLDPQMAVVAINKIFSAQGDAAKGAGNPSAPQVDADPTTRQLIVRGTKAQIEQVRSLLEKLGEDGSADATLAGQKVRTVPLKGPAAQSALTRVQEIWPTLHKNKIRVITPSAGIPSVRVSEPDGDDQAVPPSEPGDPIGPMKPSPRNDSRPQQQPNTPNTETGKTTQAAGQEPSGRDAGDKPRRWNVPVTFVAETIQAAPATPSKAKESAEPKEPAPIFVAPGPAGIVIACDDAEALHEFEQLLTSLAGGSSPGGPEMTIFYLKHAKAATVAETLDRIVSVAASAPASSVGAGGGLLGDIAGPSSGMLGLLPGFGGDNSSLKPTGTVKITPDARLNALVVRANATDAAMIEELLRILDQKGSPEDVLIVPKAKIIAIKNTQAQEMADILKQVYQDRMVAGAAPTGQARPPNPAEFMQMLRGGGGRRGGPGGAQGGQGGAQPSSEELQKMTVSIDPRTNSIVLAAPEPLFSEAEALVAQLDKAATSSNQTMKVVTLHKANSQTVQQALRAIVGDSVQTSRQPAQTSRQYGQRQQGAMQPGFTQGMTQPGMMQPGMQPYGGRGGRSSYGQSPQSGGMPVATPGGMQGGGRGTFGGR